MIERERKFHDEAMKKIRAPQIEFWSPELMKIVGMDKKYVLTFESGTAGIKKIEKK